MELSRHRDRPDRLLDRFPNRGLFGLNISFELP
jgi:hypothetical protein